jgi:hypothetical protein
MVSFNIGGPIGYENFKSSSTNIEVKEGASKYYDWAGTNATEPQKIHREEASCPECNHKFNILIKLPESSVASSNANCESSDITRNRNIDKYVLKSSIPPCPDLSAYALKSDLTTQESQTIMAQVADHTEGKRNSHKYEDAQNNAPNSALPQTQTYYQPSMPATATATATTDGGTMSSFSPDFSQNGYGGPNGGPKPYNAMGAFTNSL